MGNIYEGDVCYIEQEKIKEIVDKIYEENSLMLKIVCWEKLKDIIYFKEVGGKPKAEWVAFLNFVESYVKENVDNYQIESINNDLEINPSIELKINELFCTSVNINIILIKDEFTQKIVNSIQDILSEWDTFNKKQLDEKLQKEWSVYYNELKNNSKLFVEKLWGEIVEQVVIETMSFDTANINYSDICYNFEIK